LLLTILPAARAVEIRDVLGVAHAAGKYNFSEQDYLNEGADEILALGSRVIKVFVQPGRMEEMYGFNSDWSPDSADVVELVQRPYFQQLFAKPFSTFILEIPPVTLQPQFNDGLTPEEAAAERDQMYRLTRYLLTAYAGSDKTFVLQNWEGDHLLRAGLAEGADPDSVRLQGMIDWWNARQDGVRTARRELRPRNVDVVHGCEVNLLHAAMAGKVTATNDVLPFTRCDLYSYSSWDVDFDVGELVRALDYLRTRAPESRRFGRDNIYLGEYGMAKDHVTTGGDRYESIRGLMEAALGWGVRYAVYWEIYCNEPAQPFQDRPKNSEMRGFWLIRPDGRRAPLWSTLADQVSASLHRGAFSSFANQYVAVHPDDRAVAAGPWLRGGPWSVFTIRDWDGGDLQSGDVVSLQSHDGHYLTVEPGIGGYVSASSSTAGPSERLILRKVEGAGPIRPGDPVVFETRSHLYVSPEVRGRGALRALRAVPGPAEVFRFREAEE
jgi:hypothetical protein